MKTVKLTPGLANRKWLYLAGFSPVLLMIFLFNGIFSVRGFPYLLSILASATATNFPAWLIALVQVVGWLFVVVTSVLEAEFIFKVFTGQGPWISAERWLLTGIGAVYDLITTVSGLYHWLSTVEAVATLALPLAVLFGFVLTYIFEAIVVSIWKLT